MLRILMLPFFLTCYMVFLAAPGFAQETADVARFFTWVTPEEADWTKGILFAILGLIGALVTVFSLIGGAIPGTAGFARIETGLRRVDEREKLLDKLLHEQPRNAEEIKAVEIATNNLRDDIRINRRNQFFIASGLYAILGAFFAMLLAQDLLQAVLIGAGWTAYLGAMGLKNDYAHRKSLKDKTTEKLEEALINIRSGGSVDPLYDELSAEAQVSKAL